MRVVSVAISEKKGMKKTPVQEAVLVEGFGIEGDAHGGKWHRQVSLLAEESINKMKAMGLDVSFGSFAENISTEGLELNKLPIGTLLKLGEDVLLSVSQIGKECHTRCAIYHQAGDCVMPKEGIFAYVLRGGTIKSGDSIEILDGLTAAVMTVSDKGSKGERIDTAGPKIQVLLAELGICTVETTTVPDDIEDIQNVLKDWINSGHDLIVTTGGTGLSKRDVTPEATLPLIEKQVPGIMEAVRYHTGKITDRAYLTRGMAGVAKDSLIINLPGSEKAVEESLEVISKFLVHGLDTLKGKAKDCGRK
ncbi:MOSC domain-containing protein [Alkalicella caledoniensis]|uniref:MOSC domain-containing protein n=1 Tax=Alkalicella caledoniensis TaxID=2731377 RepID=UPI001FE7EFC8|nr:MOSC domain-containing protein [Alkalicella caledoniensis]